jgi:hypothetical protein
MIANLPNHPLPINLNVAITLRPDLAGTLIKPCSGTFRSEASWFIDLAGLQAWWDPQITHPILKRSALQGFGSVPGGSD